MTSAGTATVCPTCGSSRTEVFHEVRGVPANSCILLETAAEARSYPQGDIRLRFCRDCCFIFNAAFDPRLTEYSGRYEETQGFSPTFRRFHRALADRLVDKLGLQGRRVLEIGCGKGEFLVMLCEDGRNHGVGFDPAYREDREEVEPGETVRFVRDFYSEKYAGEPADFVCCKMTLEHIRDTGDFVRMVRSAVGRERVDVFFMVPEAERILEECAFEDVYYEHVSYFTPASLNELFSSHGFEVHELGHEYDGQYLTILTKTASAGTRSQPLGPAVGRRGDEVHELVEGFESAFQRKLEGWRTRIEDACGRGHRAVIWGSGSKGVSFLTTLGLDEGHISAAVDINPYRHGYYMPGTGHRIVGPDELVSLDPDAVIVMNRIYRDEIERDVRSRGLAAEILTLDHV